jgi:hypothetical protein
VEGRQEVAQRGLTPAAVAHLTSDALGTIDFAVLGPVKKLLKQFFSDASWTATDESALAELVGAGEGWWRHDLDDDYRLELGWRDGAFRIEVAPRHLSGDTFAGPVVPEATPNPRSIRFITPPIHDGPSRWYESAAGVDDPRVSRLFAAFDDIANVLVGPDFVAVGLHRPDQWEPIFDSMLRAITTEFASAPADLDSLDATKAEATAESPSRAETGRDGGRLERAWKALGGLRPDNPDDVARILDAAASTDSADRQVAARLLEHAAADVSEREWSRLLADPSRGVRRAVVARAGRR